MICVQQVSASINDYYYDIDKSKEVIKQVEQDYDTFKAELIDVKNEIVDISKMLNVYLDEFTNKNQIVLPKIKNVENKIIELIPISERLINNCKYNIQNSAIKNNCQNFKQNYNNMIASYEETVTKYNKVIDIYNTYAKKKNEESVDKYETDLKSKINYLLESIK